MADANTRGTGIGMDLSKIDMVSVASRVAKLASTSRALIPYVPPTALSLYVDRRRKSVKPLRSDLNRWWLIAKAAKPKSLTPTTALLGAGGVYGVSRMLGNAITSQPTYAGGYPVSPHKFVSPSLADGPDVIRRYIGSNALPFGYKNPLQYGTIPRALNHAGYVSRDNKGTPAYNDYQHLRAYANDPSPLNARGKLLAEKIKTMS